MPNNSTAAQSEKPKVGHVIARGRFKTAGGFWVFSNQCSQLQVSSSSAWCIKSKTSRWFGYEHEFLSDRLRRAYFL